MNRYIYLLIFLCSFLTTYSQELPPIQRFSPQQYLADDQNWSISQGEDESIYIANNKGLLEYNGAKWNLYASPNNTIIRSVAVIDNRVYTGSYMDFGYWEKDKFGKLGYTSLVKKFDNKLKEDEEFWNIIPLSEFVVFQSLDRIYIYNKINNAFSVIESETRITKAFKVLSTIYFQKANKGVFKIENGKAELFTDAPSITNNEIVNIFTKDNNYLFQTKESGFYIYSDGEIEKWEISANDLLSEVSVYNSIRLRNGNFILGTISNGVIKLSSNGDLLFQINKNNGLSNNTVLSTYQDISGNIWLALDNGINVLNLNSPYRVYTDGQGKLGTIYAAEKTEDNLYIGTNQGLFYKPLNGNGDFKLVEGTKGQVWFLKRLQGQLFCGHDKGTFVIDNDTSKQISFEKGTWNIKPIPGRNDIIIQGNYNGLSLLEKASNNAWKFKQRINGFDISSRYFEFNSDNELLVSHEYKGVYKLNLEQDLLSIKQYKKLNVEKGIGSSLIKFNNTIFYGFVGGLFQYDSEKMEFEVSNLLNDLFKSENYVSGKFVYDEDNNRLWSFIRNQLIYIEPGKLTDNPIVNTINLPSNLRSNKLGFENILHIGDNNYLLGTTFGYFVVDIDNFEQKNHTISLNSVEYSTLHQDSKPLQLKDSPVLLNNQNNVFFDYSVSNFNKFSPTLYRYKLEGIYDNWSDWSAKSNTLFENLPYGNYNFLVHAKVGDNLSSNTASYPFEIEKPWHLKPLAIIGYIVFFILIAAVIQYLNRIYYKKQKQKLLIAKEKEFEIRELENERQIMKFKNESLRQDIESKNRELGLSTMNLIRKNEFLNGLKKELNGLNGGKELNKIIRIIDKNINNTEDWKFFEEAFNNADKDFLKKIKKLHPTLTPNDLKLCAYLRLNLSSKEIAPLLNISHRSVEVKRYRLRKKIELPHEASLTNYILEI
ncbi:MAG: LuxR family transcriptional regulator [Winogradskyella sp.]|uniref:triple tyrosine motif-containing protein n=1 Tax=Winogradskyella sp. TaxID=1883156 RepID=UPI000F3CE5A2|nr:triple tyrosine motif-containing protein [Winogradskyella sp.]RNC84264.1 MAG: LuxR family transcriptional regulator [Winogradskyella sp.]